MNPHGATGHLFDGVRIKVRAARAVECRAVNSDTFQTAGDLAVTIASDLFRAVTGRAPLTLRAYQDDNALLVLLRFDPAAMRVDPDDGVEPLLQTAFMAMPGMVATAVQARSGAVLVPGNLSVSQERGLAVFAFTEAAPVSLTDPTARPALRLVG